MTPEELEAFVQERLASVAPMLSKLSPELRAKFEQQVRAAVAQQQTVAQKAPDPGGGMIPRPGAAVPQTGDKYLDYRGDIKTAVGLGGTLAFVTTHPEGHPTALYRLDADRIAITADPLPAGGVALTADGETLYLASADRQLFTQTGKGALKPFGAQLPAPITALLVVSGDRIAVVAGPQLLLLSRNDGSVVQILDLPETGTCLAADRTGQWLAVGTEKGTVVVFDGQDKAEFERSEAEKLHDGAVTALLFEPEELRFFSAGADHKLLTTHARGRLEPEDKGRDNNHTEPLTAMLMVPGDRFISGGRDAVVKTWPRTGAIKPAKFEDSVGKVVSLALVIVHNKTRLAICSEDNTIRFLNLTDDGRFDAVAVRAYGAIDRAKNELSQNDPKRREKSLKELAEWKDAASLDLIANQLDKDSDHQLRLLAAQLLAVSDNPRAVGLLESAIIHRDEKVRVEAFHGLRRKLAASDFRPIDAALKTGHADVGVLAVKAIEPLAAKDDQALAKLTDTLNAATWDVRKAALGGLVSVFAADPPQAGLVALGSKHGDVRVAALVRFYEHRLLDDPRVQSAVRRRLEDDEAGVRKAAFLISVLARLSLANYLRKADPELHRQLNELQGTDRPESEIPATDKAKLTPDDYDVPLQATAARALDTCLRGARALAVLGDPRAFSLLLQLSREDDAAARVEVCRALAALNDPRAVTRLLSLLLDPDASVRDAAYTALARIQANDPLTAASAGLSASADDVRRRGLQTLIEVVRAKPPGTPPTGSPNPTTEPTWFLLVQALNDAAPSVRGEAWKAVFNLKVGGGGEPTLRFAIRSVHADVRREVLTEVTANPNEPWSTPLLFEFFNDPNPQLRAESFEHSTRKTKELTPLEVALGSKFADARRLAIDALIKKKTAAAQSLLSKALHDPEKDLRQLALGAIVDENAFPVLIRAVENEHPDVRVEAAKALAHHGHPAALRPLLDLATAPEPTEQHQQAVWLDTATAALGGLTQLSDPAVVAPTQWLLTSKHAALRSAAAETLSWSVSPESAGVLKSALAHDDPEVRHRAALGLARLGDPSALGFLMAPELGQRMGMHRVLPAVVALGEAGEAAVTAYLEHTDEALRNRAVFVHLLSELRDKTGSAKRLLECLAAKSPRTRLLGTQGLELYADPEAFRAFVVKSLNDRGDETAWKIPAETVDALAAVLVAGAPQLKARAVGLLEHIVPKEQGAWNEAWAVFAKRFAPQIEAAKAAAPPRTTSQLSDEQLKQLAFGAYVGLVREQGSSAATPAIVRVRQTALSRVFAIASRDERYNRAARPVLIQAMSDPNQPVRTQAFEHLQALGLDRTRLGAEALEAGFTDLGVKGLELLSGGTSSTEGDAVLERVMLARTDNLATEAAKLLSARRGVVPTATKSLDSAHDPLRKEAVQWLAAEYEKSADAQKALRGALTSRYRFVRERAALALADKKDQAAFDALVALLKDSEFPKKQTQVIAALTGLGDPRAAGAFLDRIETDPSGTAQVAELIAASASFRVPDTAARLLAFGERKKEWRSQAFTATLTVSGFDQKIDDPEDERPDRTWETKQHPRHPAVLAKLLDRALAFGATDFVAKLLPQARWCRGSEVEEPLALLTTNPDEALRNESVQALGWRLKHRNAASEPLVRALRHKNPTTQFFAAEGLAKAKRAEGINVLLSAIEYLDDVQLRSRAMLALGELGDVRAVDVLLRLAGEDGHALQEFAAEAIGHLKQSPDAEKIGRVLERLGKLSGGVGVRAITGLRWFDTTTGWQIIRRRASESVTAPWFSRHAIKMLGYKDESANRDLLVAVMIRERHPDVLSAAFESARRLWGRDSLDPHFALLQNPNAGQWADNTTQFGDAVLTTVSERGDALRILELFPRFSPAIQGPLEASLLARPTVPVKEATAALAHADEGTVRLAARLLARSGTQDAAAKAAVASALDRWAKTWQDRRTKHDRDASQRGPLDRTTDCLRGLLWAAGRLGAGLKTVADLAGARPDDALFRPVRLEAVRCLAAVPPSDVVLTAMESVCRGTDPDARTLAADVLARHDPARAAKLLEPLASDRPSFNRLSEVPAASAFVKAAAGQVHYQPVALPTLIAAKEVDTLAAVAKDRKRPEAARLGAIEGLGVMAVESAERVLAEVGATDGDDEDVRKAAWRALRRSKRARVKTKAERG